MNKVIQIASVPLTIAGAYAFITFFFVVFPR